MKIYLLHNPIFDMRPVENLGQIYLDGISNPSKQKNLSWKRKHFKCCYFNIDGTWEKKPCPSGLSYHSYLTSPLKIELSDDNGGICDVLWPYSGYNFIISNIARQKINKGFDLFNYLDVKLYKNNVSEYKKNKFIEKDFKWAVPKKCICISDKKNNLKMSYDCGYCNLLKYTYKREFMIFDRKKIYELDIFTIAQFKRTGSVYVTEAMKCQLIDLNIGNIDFHEVGYGY